MFLDEIRDLVSGVVYCSDEDCVLFLDDCGYRRATLVNDYGEVVFVSSALCIPPCLESVKQLCLTNQVVYLTCVGSKMPIDENTLPPVPPAQLSPF